MTNFQKDYTDAEYTLYNQNIEEMDEKIKKLRKELMSTLQKNQCSKIIQNEELDLNNYHNCNLILFYIIMIEISILIFYFIFKFL